MNKKTDILMSLKKQVMILKSQLEVINKKKLSLSPNVGKFKSKSRTPHHRTSSRFDSNFVDPETVGERGIKKFVDPNEQSRNLAELIMNKSVVETKTKRISPYRIAEYNKTKENFQTEPMELTPTKYHVRNPLTGEGFSEKKVGLKMVVRPESARQDRIRGRKHFFFPL